jgi:hypothetical protein
MMPGPSWQLYLLQWTLLTASPCPLAACRNISYTSPVTNMTYHYFNCPNTFANASATCQSMGGFLTSYTSAAEQSDVESWFIRKVRQMARMPTDCLSTACVSCSARSVPCMLVCSEGQVLLNKALLQFACLDTWTHGC